MRIRAGVVGAAQVDPTLQFLVSGDPTAGQLIPAVLVVCSRSGVSERIRKVCQDFNIRAVFKFGPTLRNLLTKVIDPLLINKQSNVVHEVPCTCSKVYIGNTKPQTRYTTHV